VQIYAQYAPKYVWRPGSARNRCGSLSARPDPLAAMKGVLLRGGRGRKRRGEERDVAPPNVESWIRQCSQP